MNNPNMSMSRELRALARKAVTNNPGWKAYQRDVLAGLSSAKITTAQVIAACDAFGIDISALDAPPASRAGAKEKDAPMPEAGNEEPEADAGAFEGFEGMNPDDLVRNALAPVSNMLGTKLLDLLTTSIAPLAIAASAGPRVIASGDGTAAAPALPHVRQTGTGTARDLFKVKGTAPLLGRPLAVCNGTGAHGVPEADPDYVWDADALAALCASALLSLEGGKKARRSNVLLTGPASAGKTTAAEQFAAVTGRPFVRIAFSGSTEALELIGQKLPTPDGGTCFSEGALVRAMQVPFCVILLDEPSFLPPAVAATLQTVLDSRSVYLKEDGNRLVKMARGVMVVAADNTNLTGDQTGRYAGTVAQNLALQDRFAWIVRMGYMAKGVEAATLAKVTGLERKACDLMCDIASTSRNGAVNGTVSTGISFRRLQAWADGVMLGMPSATAFESAIMAGADPADSETLRGYERASNPHKEIDRLASGTPEAKPAPAPSAAGAAAATAFGNTPLDDVDGLASRILERLDATAGAPNANGGLEWYCSIANHGRYTITFNETRNPAWTIYTRTGATFGHADGKAHAAYVCAQAISGGL